MQASICYVSRMWKQKALYMAVIKVSYAQIQQECFCGQDGCSVPYQMEERRGGADPPILQQECFIVPVNVRGFFIHLS